MDFWSSGEEIDDIDVDDEFGILVRASLTGR
jgi:hypothetical protein